MAVWCTMLPAAMHHFRGMGAPWRRCRTSGEGVCFARSGCRTTNGQGVVLARRTQVDGRAAALKLILNKHGTITPYGVVYDNGMELEKFYKEGGPFPDYLDREFVILLEASYGEGQSTLLVLPDSPERLERLLCRTGIRDSPHFWIVDSTLPGEVISSIPAERLSINGLNRLCQAVERIAPEDLKTLVQLLADKDHPSQGPSLGGLSM